VSAPRILAIDDQVYFRSFIETLLGEEGYDVVTAASAEAGRALAERGPFDLVLIDLVGGGSSAGRDGVASIRQRCPDADVVVVTGIGDIRSVVGAMQEGAVDYLLKPIDREALLQAIAGVFDNRKVRTENARLVDENLEFMGRLALLERMLPLIGEADPALAGRELLELLAIEVGAESGQLWAKLEVNGPLEPVALWGEEAGQRRGRWAPEERDGDIEPALCRGTTVEPCAGRVVLPFADDGVLLAVAELRISAKELSADHRASCEKVGQVGAMLLANAQLLKQLQGETLRESASGLPGRTYLERVLHTDIQRAHRYGRRLSILCLDLSDETEPTRLARAAEVMERSLRSTEVLCCEGGNRFWVLVAETDALASVVVKRRLAERVGEALGRSPAQWPAVGLSTFPRDGEAPGVLLAAAAAGLDEERHSLVHELGLDPRSSLSTIGDRLLARAPLLPGEIVAEAIDLLLGELTCHPRERGLLFLAPGTDQQEVLPRLSLVTERDADTEIYLASDGDTLPNGPRVTAVGLPPEVPPDVTWIVRFGEPVPYALIAGPPREDQTRPVYHTNDTTLVERLTYRLRSEVGLGVRA